MNNRFKELRKTLKKNQQDFADSINLSRSFIAQIEIGVQITKDEKIKMEEQRIEEDKQRKKSNFVISNCYILQRLCQIIKD